MYIDIYRYILKTHSSLEQSLLLTSQRILSYSTAECILVLSLGDANGDLHSFKCTPTHLHTAKIGKKKKPKIMQHR